MTSPAQSDDQRDPWREENVWRVHLSGGGVRATLCSLGALWQFRRRFPESKISEIVSVSGGSLASAALLRDQPGPEGMDDFVSDVFHRVRMNISTVASLIALVGLVVVVLGATIARPSWLSDGWGAWAFSICLVIWLLAVSVVRVLALSLVVLVVAVLSVEYDVAPRVEGRIAAVALGLIVLTIAGVVGRRRSNDPLGKTVERRRREPTRLQLGGMWATAFGFVSLMWLLLTHPWQPLVHGVLTVVSVGVVSLVLGPLLLRGYLGRLIGDDMAVEHLDQVQKDAGHASWAARHAVVTTSLRDEVPGFFVIDVPRFAGEEAGKPIVVVDEVTDGAPRLAMRADRVQTVTMLQASAAAFPQFAPTIAFGTRTLERPAPSGDQDEDRRSRAPALPLFADGGLRGTLGTQYTRSVEREIADVTVGSRAQPQHARTLVVDATRRRAQMFWWPVLLLPKYGSSVIQLRLVQAMLSALVDEERMSFRKANDRDPSRPRFDPQGRSTDSVLLAEATGACFMRLPDATAQSDVDLFRRLMYHVRAQVDRQTGWFPPRNRAAACVVGGALAVIDAVEEPAEKMRVANATVNELERLLGVSLALEHVRHVPVGGRKPHPVRWTIWDQLGAVARGSGRLIQRAARWAIRAIVDFRAVRLSKRHLAGLCRWTTAVIAIAFVATSTVRTNLPIADGCEPVCADGPRHEAFGTGFVAVSHQGVGGASNVIRRQGFVDARALGFTNFETDVGLVEADATGSRRLVAIHKNSEPSIEEATGAPEVTGLLHDEAFAGSVWHLELNSTDDALVAALSDAIAGVPDGVHVCVHFGSILKPWKVNAVTDALPRDTCVCASVPERLRTADLPLARFVTQGAIDLVEGVFGGSRDRVDCSVVYEGSADERDVTEAGEGVVVMAWANGAGTETRERLKRLVCDGFGGIITNDAAMLRDVLIDTGVWDAEGHPTGEKPKGCLGDV